MCLKINLFVQNVCHVYILRQEASKNVLQFLDVKLIALRCFTTLYMVDTPSRKCNSISAISMKNRARQLISDGAFFRGYIGVIVGSVIWPDMPTFFFKFLQYFMSIRIFCNRRVRSCQDVPVAVISSIFTDFPREFWHLREEVKWFLNIHGSK